MKNFLIVFCLAVIPAAEAIAAPGFSWFHTRPKPVLLEPNEPPAVAAKTKVAYHGTAVYPRSGRLYFQDAADRQNQREASPRARVSTVFSRGWSTGAASKPSRSK